jgi:hypothetical protein
MKIYSYIVKYVTGLAPNPFFGKLTLNVCKPVIRRTANVGDWIIGTGSRNVKTKSGNKDYAGKLVYAMKITAKMTMKEYDTYCQEELNKKIPFPDKKDWKRSLGDSIYDYSESDIPKIRKGLHDETNKATDLSGLNTLVSDHFYYFGENAVNVPIHLQEQKLIKNEQGHFVITELTLIEEFEHWISQFELNKIYGNPQLLWKLEKEGIENCKLECDE